MDLKIISLMVWTGYVSLRIGKMVANYEDGTE